MFAEHQPIIQAWADQSPDNLARVLQLAIITARQPFINAPADMETAMRGERDATSVLFSWKARSFAEIWADRASIFWNCHEILYHAEDTRDAENALLAYVASIHGLGFAKAGFSIQMAFGLSGCLDTHNLFRLGVKPSVCRPRNERDYKLGTMYARVDLYNSLVHKAGGTEKLWNDWCAYVAKRQPKLYRDAEHVSSLHLIALGLN